MKEQWRSLKYRKNKWYFGRRTILFAMCVDKEIISMYYSYVICAIFTAVISFATLLLTTQSLKVTGSAGIANQMLNITSTIHPKLTLSLQIARKLKKKKNKINQLQQEQDLTILNLGLKSSED
jgi:hypothetical protein